MRETASESIADRAPRAHKIVRVVFFLTSFSWTLNPVQNYMTGSTPIESIITRMIPMLIVALYCVVCPYRGMINRMFRPALWPLLWYIFFGILCGISGIQPALSAWKGAEMIIALMFIYVSCRDEQTTKSEFIAWLKLNEILIWATIVLALINPSLGFRHSPSILPWLQGYLPIINPNALGFISILVLARLLFFPAKYKPIRILIVFGALLCAQSRTSYAVALIMLVIFIIDGIRQKKFPRVIIAFFFALIALALATGMQDLIVKIVMRGQTSEEMSTLSGRSNYWAFALEHAGLAGKGLATGSRSLIFIGQDTFYKGTVNLHNSFMEALMDSGYIGAVPFLFFIIFNVLRQGIHTITRTSMTEALFLICAIAFVARGMTSVVLALFSFDFNNMMFLWAWLYTRNMTEGGTTSLSPKRPVPICYQKTLAEQMQEKNQITCQPAHSE